MKIHSEAEWQQQCAVLAASDDPVAEILKDFTTIWAEYAERLMEEPEDISPINGLRLAISTTVAEVRQVPVMGFIGPALMLLCSCWAPAAQDREAFFDSLNPIEQMIYLDAATLWAHNQRKKAQD